MRESCLPGRANITGAGCAGGAFNMAEANEQSEYKLCIAIDRALRSPIWMLPLERKLNSTLKKNRRNHGSFSSADQLF